MKNLTCAECPVSMILKMLGQRDTVLVSLHGPKRRSQTIDPRRCWSESQQQAGTRWITERSLAMSIQECRPATCQSVDVRRLCQRMAAEGSNPIVLVVDGNKQHVRLAGVFRRQHGLMSDQKTKGKSDQASLEHVNHSRKMLRQYLLNHLSSSDDVGSTLDIEKLRVWCEPQTVHDRCGEVFRTDTA